MRKVIDIKGCIETHFNAGLGINESTVKVEKQY
jgi:hypothetical protein